MNMINIIIAKANQATVQEGTLKLTRGTYHVFDHTGEYRDRVDLRNTHENYITTLQTKYKRCLFIHGYGHKDEWRHDWVWINSDGKIATGIDFEADYSEYVKVIDPKKRKPWYWDRKLTALKAEYPNWDTDVQEAVNMRSDCKEILAELESNFNINNNYYRIQNNAAMEAHSIILGCDSLVDAFEYNLARDEELLREREYNSWSDESDDLQ